MTTCIERKKSNTTAKKNIMRLVKLQHLVAKCPQFYGGPDLQRAGFWRAGFPRASGPP